MRIALQRIRDMAAHRPEGYYTEIVSHGVIDGEDLVLDQITYQKLCRKYRPTMPTLSEMLGNFTRAVKEWSSAGYPVVSNDVFTDRLEECENCPHWTGNRCAKCGCFKLKMWLETERCPINRW